MDHHQEPDGINETFAGALRVSLTATAHVAEQLARTREQQARDLQARLHAGRAAARVALALVACEDWWQRADVDDIARAWETAHAWREHDPDVRQAAERIDREVRDRYGIDTSDLRAAEGAVRGVTGRGKTGYVREAVALLGAERGDADQRARHDHDDEPRDVTDHVAEPADREILAAALHGVADEQPSKRG